MNHSVPHSHGNWGICVGKVLIVTRFLLGGDYDNNGHGVCLYVCHKSDYFRIQGIWSFLMFLESFRIQKCLETGKPKNPSKKSLFSREFVVFPCSRHFPYSRDFAVSPVSRHFSYSRDFIVSPVSRHFWKRLEG